MSGARIEVRDGDLGKALRKLGAAHAGDRAQIMRRRGYVGPAESRRLKDHAAKVRLERRQRRGRQGRPEVLD